MLTSTVLSLLASGYDLTLEFARVTLTEGAVELSQKALLYLQFNAEEEELYHIHQLTHTFVNRKVFGWVQ